MASQVGVQSSPPVRRIIITWVVILAGIVLAFFATVLMLNSTLYSAGGFVGSYLSTLARHDVDGALATPGVVGVDGAGDELLRRDALAELTDIRQVLDEELGSGVHLVGYEYDLGGTPAESTFLVRYEGPRLGLFSSWSFDVSPISVLEVTPLNNPMFEVNGIPLSSDEPSSSAVFQVLTPGRFVLEHDSALLEADPLAVRVTSANTIVPAELEMRASEDFVDRIQREVDSALDDCTKEQVLFPTGCPFGHSLANRVESPPEWTISDYPEVVIEPGPTPGTWVVPDVPGVAHLTVQVRSLFDGTVSTFDEDVPFTLRWTITLRPDGGISILAEQA